MKKYILKKRHLLTALFMGLSPLVLFGCASIVGGKGPQTIAVNAGSVVKAKYTIINDRTGKTVSSGVTPATVALERSAGFFQKGRYRVEVTHPDTGKVHSAVVQGRPTGWYLGGNIIFGGWLGWFLVDPATGAMWTLRPKSVEAPF